jgi:hypothetical protein
VVEALIMRKQRAKTKAKPVTAPKFVVKAALTPDPELLAENEAIAINQENWAGQAHKLVEADWTTPNGHPRCILCGQEGRGGGMCSPITKSDGNTDAGLLDGGSTPLHTATPSFRQRHGVHPYEALLHPPEGVEPGEIIKALIAEAMKKRAVNASIVEEVTRATEKLERREAGSDWLSDYGEVGDQAELERQRRTTTAPAVDAVAAPVVKAVAQAFTEQTAQLVEKLKALTKLVASPKFKAAIRRRMLEVAKHAEAVETLKAVNKDRTVRGLRPFPVDLDIVRDWIPKD